jgi:hypothetical protein
LGHNTVNESIEESGPEVEPYGISKTTGKRWQKYSKNFNK